MKLSARNNGRLFSQNVWKFLQKQIYTQAWYTLSQQLLFTSRLNLIHLDFKAAKISAQMLPQTTVSNLNGVQIWYTECGKLIESTKSPSRKQSVIQIVRNIIKKASKVKCWRRESPWHARDHVLGVQHGVSGLKDYEVFLMAFSILLAFFCSVDFPDIECLGIRRTRERRPLRFLCFLIRALARLGRGLLFSHCQTELCFPLFAYFIFRSLRRWSKDCSMQLLHFRLSQRLQLDIISIVITILVDCKQTHLYLRHL